MNIIGSLFKGSSPFFLLQMHMKKVVLCVDKVREIFKLLQENNLEFLEKLSQELSSVEHEADLMKNDIRNHLSKRTLLLVDRSDFLEILSLQDSIADKAEDIAVFLTFYPLEMFDSFASNFKNFVRLYVNVSP